jgi:hypothetical protein
MTDTTHDDLVKRICEEWVKDGRSEDCFWEGWPECPTPEDSLTPRMVIDRIEELSNCVAVLEAKLAKVVDALHSIDVYGSDTLSGCSDGLSDAKWYRYGVIEMRNRARNTLAAITETPHD